MAAGKRKAPAKQKRAQDYRHGTTRPNNPEAGLQSFDRKVATRVRYEYDPHLDPQLVWASKAEHTSFEVDTVSLHIHERISTQAVLRTLKHESAQRNLFGDPELPLDRAVRFYEHEVGWTNRLILGDSLLVMNSLLERELTGGKVQVIYFDPPYGVSYDSNFQPTMRSRTVRDGKDDDLTREPEQIKAYRDAWTLGVHTYLSYLRDRFLLCRELLGDTGSMFVQIGEENLHRARLVMEEVFGAENCIAQICFRKKMMPLGAPGFESVSDYILWYSKDRTKVKLRELFRPQVIVGDATWGWVELGDGSRRRLSREEIDDHDLLPSKARVYQPISLKPRQYRKNQDFEFEFERRSFPPPGGGCWATTREGMDRLAKARRLQPSGKDSLRYVLFHADYPVIRLTSMWADTGPPSDMRYVVETNPVVVGRCILASSDPGDLILDPTCGSGTTAYVAEQWGRRWITCDTSRVALALARQRVMTATYPFYRLAYESQGVASGFVYEEVPHVTLKSIAQDLPPEKERLYDRPEVVPNVVRVSGPFTVEAINTLDPGEGLAFEPIEEKARGDDISHRGDGASTVNDHISQVLDLLRKDSGLNVPGKGRIEIEGLGRLTTRPGLHAAGTAHIDGNASRLAFAFGPRYGPVTARLVEEAVHTALGSYEALVVAGFSFDPEVSAFLDKSPPSGLRLFRVQIAPDVLIGDLLKTQRKQNLFTVMGEPDYSVRKAREGYVVTLKGVDIYDPNKNEVAQGQLGDVAAWFVDHDYDGRTFCVCQVFLPAEQGKSFDKLQRALKGVVNEDAWDAMSGFESRPFRAGEHERVAVKVIDVRGNEVVGVRKLGR